MITGQPVREGLTGLMGLTGYHKKIDSADAEGHVGDSRSVVSTRTHTPLEACFARRATERSFHSLSEVGVSEARDAIGADNTTRKP